MSSASLFSERLGFGSLSPYPARSYCRIYIPNSSISSCRINVNVILVGKKKERVEKENEKNDEVETSEKVEEKVVSEEEKKKSNEQTTNKGKAIVNHPPIEHLPYPHAPSKKDKER